VLTTNCSAKRRVSLGAFAALFKLVLILNPTSPNYQSINNSFLFIALKDYCSAKNRVPLAAFHLCA
jgi:hypothetical protein